MRAVRNSPGRRFVAVEAEVGKSGATVELLFVNGARMVQSAKSRSISLLDNCRPDEIGGMDGRGATYAPSCSHQYSTRRFCFPSPANFAKPFMGKSDAVVDDSNDHGASFVPFVIA